MTCVTQGMQGKTSQRIPMQHVRIVIQHINMDAANQCIVDYFTSDAHSCLRKLVNGAAAVEATPSASA